MATRCNCIEARVRRTVVGLTSAAQQRHHRREHGKRAEWDGCSRKLQRPSTVSLWRVHMSKSVRALPSQKPIGKHASSVPRTLERCERHSTVRDQPMYVYHLSGVAPLDESLGAARLHLLPLHRSVLTERAAP